MVAQTSGGSGESGGSGGFEGFTGEDGERGARDKETFTGSDSKRPSQRRGCIDDTMKKLVGNRRRRGRRTRFQPASAATKRNSGFWGARRTDGRREG
ncbi:unnamed protein product [Microthlaspi erraticum]|uniref:Uncharacterized protein n=1 Tax=Microthlaspi erraticum TaxID=1685480 RepID=A0A6D2I8H8_9BRAS|nr:unnamed protein product [Microthlaspi erraticum]